MDMLNRGLVEEVEGTEPVKVMKITLFSASNWNRYPVLKETVMASDADVSAVPLLIVMTTLVSWSISMSQKYRIASVSMSVLGTENW